MKFQPYSLHAFLPKKFHTCSLYPFLPIIFQTSFPYPIQFSYLFSLTILTNITPSTSPWPIPSRCLCVICSKSTVPPNNGWRMILLHKLLATWSQKKASLKDCKHLTQMIDSLCNTYMFLFYLLSSHAWEPHLPQDMCYNLRGASSNFFFF
jgi:hypothetical protein